MQKNPIVIAAWRLLETSIIVSLLTFLATVQSALMSPAGLASYDWRTALTALALGVASGLVNAAVTALNLYWQQLKGSS